jgi:hypothetical protein
MNTPKAFANFSPGLERSDNPGLTKNNLIEQIFDQDPRVGAQRQTLG